MSDPKPALPAPSELFLSAIRSAGSIVIDCELCGRTHFGDGRGDYEEGEYERLLAKAKTEPDKYIQHHDDDMVSYGYLQGKQAVLDCPCHELTRYEKFIWAHRWLIASYFRARLKENIQKLELDLEQCRLPKELLTDDDPMPKRERKFRFD